MLAYTGLSRKLAARVHILLSGTQSLHVEALEAHHRWRYGPGFRLIVITTGHLSEVQPPADVYNPPMPFGFNITRRRISSRD